MGFYYIDEKYLLQISPQLPLFKRKKDGVYNHRCPFCGDSKKNPTKCRGFHYEYKGTLIYRCHNCGKTCTTANFIKELDLDLYKQYRMEVFKEFRGKTFRSPVKAPPPAPPKPAEGSLFNGLMDSINLLPPAHKAVQLLAKRKIPKDRWDDLFYLGDMRKIAQLNPKYKDKLTRAEDRLIIPYRDKTGKVIGVTCRSFEADAALRYIAIPISEDAPQIYGYDRVDLSKPVYVLEGAFDSMFIPNSIAVSGSNLKMIDRVLPKDQVILIYDAQPRNKEIVSQIRTAIEKNYTVVLLPETGYKDINAMIEGGYTTEKILSMIEKNTVRGLSAKTKFSLWKKIS